MDGDLDSNDGIGNQDNSNNGSSSKNFTCRFCKRNFSKSQALGGHMNGHRQERDNENYNKAKDLVEQKDGSSSSMMMMVGQIGQSNNQYVAPQMYSSIPGGVQKHVELSSSSQVQTQAQIGCPSSFSTYSNQNIGGGISRVGASLPSPYLNQQQQQQQQAFAQNLAGQYRNTSSIPSHPNYQIRGTYPSLPYQSSMNNNLQIGGGASSLNNLGIRGPSLPMNSNLQITEPSFPTLQGRHPNVVVSGQAAAAAPSEQQQQFFNVGPSPQPWRGNKPTR